jgi:hypothetical protein
LSGFYKLYPFYSLRLCAFASPISRKGAEIQSIF